MKIGIVDADLIGRTKHRFPNLACEKISGYWKAHDAEVTLLTDFNCFNDYDSVYVSKVFTDTPVPEWLCETDRVHTGGTGFFFDQAPNLPFEIEHHMPDYHLYDAWIAEELRRAKEQSVDIHIDFDERSFIRQFKAYTDYSIGFMTRGCFRKCKFCVNQKYDQVFINSPLDEFYDESRKKICLLDDNFLGCSMWKDLLQELIDTNKPFTFKQGLDERLLTDEKCEMLFNAKYDGDYTFAFDNIADYDLIRSKLDMIRRHTTIKNIKFYILVGFDGTGPEDIENAFKRIELLMQYQCIPYVMRYQNKHFAPWRFSPFSDLYTAIARWCNQPSFFKKMSFREFCSKQQALHKTEGTYCATFKAMMSFELLYPDIAAKYFDLRF